MTQLMLLLILGGALVICGICYSCYVKVIQIKNNAREALASIDVQLKKRYDLIPNILTIAQKFMDHERNLLEDIVKLRTQANNMRSDFNTMSEKLHLESELQSKMHQLMISVENYPQLKSDATMVQAMKTYNEVEEHIAAARRFYNSAVKELNNAVEIWPSSVFAQMCGITASLPYFEIENAVEREAISAADYLK